MRRTICILMTLATMTAEAQWQKLAGPEGGTVLALSGSGDTVFAGTKGGGVFRTWNGGTQWTAVNNGLTKFDIEALAVSGQTVYAGGYNTEGGFFVSTDYGANWSDRSAGFTSKYIKAILRTESALLVGTYGYGLFRSTDEGNTWTKSDSGLTSTAVNALFKHNGLVYAGTVGGVFVSGDDGISWTPRSTGLTTAFVQSLTGRDSMVFAGTTNGVFVTVNAGTSWTPKNNGLSFSVVYAMGWSGARLLAATNASVCFSNNNGDAWNNPVPSNGMSGYTVTPAMLITGNTVYAATMYDVYRSTNNGVNWTPRTGGIAASSSMGLLATPTTLLTGFGTFGVKRSTDWGRSWRSSDSTLMTQVRSFFRGDQNLHMAASTGNLFHSTDQGGKWVLDSLPTGVTVIATGWAKIGSTLFISDNGKGVFKSTNGGGKWTAASDNSLPKSVWSLLAVDTVLYAGTTTGVYRSVNGGTTWVPMNGNAPSLQTSLVTSLAYANGTLFAAVSELGIVASVNGGTTWRSYGTPVLSNVSSLQVLQQRLFAATSKDGLVLLKDTVWSPFLTGLPTKQIGTLQTAGDTLYVSTLGMGVWKRPFADVLTGADRRFPEAPAEFALEPNYPNPFNPSTRIRFTLASARAVTLTVYDAVGREVRVLASGPLEAGRYDVRFDAAGLSSGVYFCRLVAGASSATRTMLFIQ